MSAETGGCRYDMVMRRNLYIETMGCQMNKLDSELVSGRLVDAGYRLCDDPEQAGVIVFNTCSVRQHAEDKVISKISQLRRRHVEKGDLVLVVIGCMAERMGEELRQRHGEVDVVCGPGQLHRLVDLIEKAVSERVPSVVQNDPAELDKLEELDTTRQRHEGDNPYSAYVRVMRGCDNFCHYCIVPYVRGRERSRPIDHVVQECQRLVDGEVKEITLVGQRVNAYKYEKGGRQLGLADILERVSEIDGLAKLRFVTSFPRGFDERIFEAMAGLPNVCEYLHLPAQSGSDRILKAMNRGYTVQEYVELVERGREIVPGLAVAGDFIVGFCGETEGDFAATAELIRRVRYKNCFIFKYSPRPGTRADKKLGDDVPDDVKRRRNHELLELQSEISLADNQRYVGRVVKVMVEGPSKKPHLNCGESVDGGGGDGDEIEGDDGDNGREGCGKGNCDVQARGLLQLVGRTPGDHIVVFNGVADELTGQIVDVRVTSASALTLFGELPS